MNEIKHDSAAVKSGVTCRARNSVSVRLVEFLQFQRMPILLVMLTISVLAVLELKQPYFFLQDDSMVLSLPLYVHNFRAMIGGELPLYNFHQYLGMPVGVQSNSYYLINYLAVGASRLTLGHYFGTMEYLALFHLVAAALGFYHLMLRFGIEKICCVMGALTWVFSAFVITVGNSWIQIACYAAYMPWILLYSLRLIDRFEKRDFIILVLLRVGALFVGHPQYSCYIMTFDFITVLFVRCLVCSKLMGNTPKDEFVGYTSFGRFLWRYSASCLFALGISLPMILQVLREAASSVSRSQKMPLERFMSGSYDLTQWLKGLIAPYADVQVVTWNDLGFISHIGYLPLIFIAAALILMRKEKKSIYVGGFLCLAVFSLLWAGGTFVTRFFYVLPIYDKFTTPFKLVFFTSFYLVIISTIGAGMLYRLLTERIGHTRVSLLFNLLLMLLLINILVLYASGRQHSLMTFPDRIPIEEPLQNALREAEGRIVSTGQDIRMDGEKVVPDNSSKLLGYNYATMWGLSHFGGYWGLVSEKHFEATMGAVNSSVYSHSTDVSFEVPVDTLQKFRTWGVKWYFIDSLIPPPTTSEFKIIHRDAARYLLYDSLAKPMVYWLDSTGKGGVNYRFSTNSVQLYTNRDADASLLLNVLYHPFFSASMDGKPIQIIQTVDGQVLLNIPKGRHVVVVNYRDKLFIYSAIFSLSLILLLIWYDAIVKRLLIIISRINS